MDSSPVTAKVGNVNAPEVQALLATMKNLYVEDAEYILNKGTALADKIGKHLDGAALTAVTDKLTKISNRDQMADLFS